MAFMVAIENSKNAAGSRQLRARRRIACKARAGGLDWTADGALDAKSGGAQQAINHVLHWLRFEVNFRREDSWTLAGKE